MDKVLRLYGSSVEEMSAALEVFRMDPEADERFFE